MAPKAKAPPKAPPRAPASLTTKTTRATEAPPKNFSVSPWTGEGDGEKVVGYGDTGQGKTTLFSMMPNPIFIGLDDGGRRIRNPKTGEPISHISGIETLDDVRAALRQTDLFPRGSSCVIDTLTLLEQVIERHVLDTIPLPKGGGKARNIKSYGWNDGSSHMMDVLRLVLQDLDALVRRGVNIGLICQEQAITIVNTEGLDYLKACPKLHHDKQSSLMLEVGAWADHVFRITYLNTSVRPDGERATGKIVTTESTRAIFIGGAPHYLAKHKIRDRLIGEDGELIECISFETPDDDALWQFLFGKKE